MIFFAGFSLYIINFVGHNMKNMTIRELYYIFADFPNWNFCGVGGGGGTGGRGCSVDQLAGGSSRAQKGTSQLRRVQHSLVGCSVAQQIASQLNRVQRSSLGCSLAQKSAAQLCKVQCSLVGCSVSQESAMQHSAVGSSIALQDATKLSWVQPSLEGWGERRGILYFKASVVQWKDICPGGPSSGLKGNIMFLEIVNLQFLRDE